MKKYYSIILILISALFLTSCKKTEELIDNYSDNILESIDISKDEIKIMQLTDLHLTYGFDGLDRQTFKMLDKLVKRENPDLIVVTGDVFMSVYARRLLKKFINKMESFKIPWAYTFGNHEREYHSMETLVNIIMNMKTNYLYFHYGPKLSNDKSHGYSNYKINIKNGNNDIMSIYLLDTKANRKDGVVDKDLPYDYLSEEQVLWYQNELVKDTVKSLAFMHIPLQQYFEYEGQVNEQIWAQGKDTGFFQTILDSGNKTLGVFVGHDHKNNHEFLLNGVMLAYGVSSGFNAYGANNTKGARIITFNSVTEKLSTYKVFTGDL